MPDPKKSDNVIVSLTFNFALEIVDFCDLLEQRRKWALSNQLFRAGTSIGANTREAQNAESKSDFIHKFKIVAKETEETMFWLEMCQYSSKLPDCPQLIEQLKHIQNIVNKIIITSKAK